MKYKHYKYNFKDDLRLAILHVALDLGNARFKRLLKMLTHAMVNNVEPQTIVNLVHQHNIQGFQATAVVWQAKRNLTLRLEKY